jgi:hypothetical protein
MQHIAPEHKRIIRDDRLVQVVQDTRTGRVIRQGKRTTSTMLSRTEIRTYVEDGPIPAVKLIMANHKLRLAAAYELLKATRGENKGIGQSFTTLPELV